MAVKTEYIRDFGKKIIGIIEYKNNGDKVAYSFPGRKILGYYRKAQDHTTNAGYRILTKGDTLISLIFSTNKK